MIEKASSPFENGLDEPPVYLPSDWLSTVVPKRVPYFPQMGDILVYFMQGHKCYIDIVKSLNIYKVDEKDLPWKHMELEVNTILK